MSYNLYQVQMARAWAQRIEKEQAMADRFWQEQAMKTTQALRDTVRTGTAGGPASVAGTLVSSACPSGYTSKTSFLKDRLARLEDELKHERERRQHVEQEIVSMRQAISKPSTPASLRG